MIFRSVLIESETNGSATRTLILGISRKRLRILIVQNWWVVLGYTGKGLT